MEENLSNGSIASYNPSNQTGIIRSFEGVEVIFHIKDIAGTSTKETSATPSVGQMAVFRTEKTEYGLQAREITLLSMKQNMAKYK